MKDWRTDELDVTFPNENKEEEVKVEESQPESQPVIEEKEVQHTDIEELLQKYINKDVIFDKLDTIINLLSNESQPKTETSSNQILEDVLKKQEKNNGLLVQYLKQNAEFQQQVRINMNKENEQLKKEILGERLDPLLKSIATVYGEYYHLLKYETEDTAYQKQVSFLLESLEDILLEYGCNVESSEPGVERSTRTTKIKQPMVLTGDRHLHRTVITSFNPSVSKGKKILYPEYVSIYKFDESLEEKHEEVTVEDTLLDQETIETVDVDIVENGEEKE